MVVLVVLPALLVEAVAVVAHLLLGPMVQAVQEVQAVLVWHQHLVVLVLFMQAAVAVVLLVVAPEATVVLVLVVLEVAVQMV
jgi:hypothetical protein